MFLFFMTFSYYVKDAQREATLGMLD